MTNVISRVSDAIATHYRNTFDQHGATYAGVDWPKEEDALLRYALHIRGLKGRGVTSVLDVGCGIGLFYEYLQTAETCSELVPKYTGVDFLECMIQAARAKYPSGCFIMDSIETGLTAAPRADWVVANGVFTVKGSAKKEDMRVFVEYSLGVLWEKAIRGMSFNLMTAHVDYRYDWLFYMDPAEVVAMSCKRFGRRFAVYHDSRLFDSIYVWVKDPSGLWQS